MIFPRKFLMAAEALLAAAVLFSGCRFGREENALVYDLDAVPVNLDPQSAADAASQLVIQCIFEGLVTADDDGSIHPAAAEDWSVSGDGLTYTFYLREDAKWANGDPVTAADFVFGFQRLLNPDTDAPDAEVYFGIENAEEVASGQMEPETLGVAAPSEKELVIRLEEADSRFLELLDQPAAMPCHAEFFAETKGRYGLGANLIMGNGAFYLNSWPEDGNLSLRPSQTYHSASSVTATSLLLVVPKEGRDSKLQRFTDGTVSAAAFTGKEYLELSGGDYTVLENDSAVWGLVFNTQREPFSNFSIRRALFLDADFSTMEPELPEYLERISAAVSPGIVMGQGESYRKLAGMPVFPARDLSAAQEARDQALEEVSPDSLRTARLIVPEGEGHETYFAYLSQIWQRDLRVYLTVEVLPQAEYDARLQSGDFECAIYRLSGEYNSPGSVLSAMEGGLYGCSDPAYGELLARAGEAEGSEAAALWLQAEQMLFDQCLFLPLYRQSEYFLLNTGISGVTYDFYSRTPDFRFGVVD